MVFYREHLIYKFAGLYNSYCSIIESSKKKSNGCTALRVSHPVPGRIQMIQKFCLSHRSQMVDICMFRHGCLNDCLFYRLLAKSEGSKEELFIVLHPIICGTNLLKLSVIKPLVSRMPIPAGSHPIIHDPITG